MLKEIVLETKKKLNEFVDASIFQKILGFDHHQILNITEELDSIENSINDVVKQIDGSLINSFKIEKNDEQNNFNSFSISLAEKPSIGFEDKLNKTNSLKSEFEKTLVTYLDIKKSLINKLKTIKGSMYNINGKTICLRLIDKYV